VAPTFNGGSEITGYTVRSFPDGITAMGLTSPINVSDLTNGTSYRFTVVATNEEGNSEALLQSMAVTPAAPVCPTTTISYNNYTYNTVGIGTQCWMKENLITRFYNDGTQIRFDTSGGSEGSTSQTWAGTGLNYGAYTIYAHDSTANPSNLISYGYLYNWYAAKGIITDGGTSTKNICPTGWHVPTDSDWNKLVKSIDSDADTTGINTQSSTAGTLMKKNDALWTYNTGTNTSGFSALPGGYRTDGGNFSVIKSLAFFWSAAEEDINTAWGRTLYGYNDKVNRVTYFYYKSLGLSVRCLKD
jgi:uncharacterized protein (TIGR02145 family)